MLMERRFNKMKYESDLVYLLEANGASEKDCKEADKILKERKYRSGAYIEDSDTLYEDLLLLGLLHEKSRIIPGKLGQKIFSLRQLITVSACSKGREYKGSLTTKGHESFSRVYDEIKKADLRKFKELNDYVTYLNLKMNS